MNDPDEMIAHALRLKPEAWEHRGTIERGHFVPRRDAERIVEALDEDDPRRPAFAARPKAYRQNARTAEGLVISGALRTALLGDGAAEPVDRPDPVEPEPGEGVDPAEPGGDETVRTAVEPEAGEA